VAAGCSLEGVAPGNSNRCRGTKGPGDCMMLNLAAGDGGHLRVLCLEAHSEDIEIGCGCTVHRLAAGYPAATVQGAAFSAIGVGAGEARRAACLFAGPKRKEASSKPFPDGFLPYIGPEARRRKRWFDEETLSSVEHLHGTECNSSSGYTEASYCRKLVL
jgi:hypothetical protein